MKVALVGNQNSGKTTLFNTLTGSNQKVGNWPGVTIERKEGTIIDTNVEIIDLPGVYSLSPYSSEEEISRQFVMEEKPDLIINIIDATSLERSLYLTTQLLELDIDVVIALNMADVLEKSGITVDVEKLSKRLNTTIVSISAKKNLGIKQLISVVK
ncbi:MAG: FeoB small GTPase domain-containing protein, partial [Bacilli bacterium]